MKYEDTMKMLTVLMSAFLLVAPGVSTAQDIYGRDSTSPAITGQALDYERFSRSNVTAILFSLCVPSSGHAYAGNWARGLPFAAARLGSMTGMLVSQDQRDRDNNSNPVLIVSSLAYLTFTVWEAIDASAQVDEYNEELRNARHSPPYGVALLPADGGVVIQFVWHI